MSLEGKKEKKMQIKQAVSLYRAYMGSPEKNLSQNTIRNYGDSLDKMAVFLKDAGITNIENIGIRNLRDYLSHRKAGMQSKTCKTGDHMIHVTVAAIKGFFKWAVNEELVSADPASVLAAPKMPKSMPRFITETDFKAFLRACDDPEDQELFMFMAGTGVRRDEVNKVLVSDVIRNQKIIYIRGKGQKERINPFVPMPVLKMIGERVKKLGIKAGDPVFDYSANQVSYRMESVLKKTDGSVPHFSPHALRRLFADRLLNKVSLNAIQTALGHASIQTTTIYLNTSTAMMMGERDKLDAVDGTSKIKAS